MPRRKKHYGVGAQVTVKSKYLHPHLYITKTIGLENIPDNHSVNEATIKRQEVKYVRRKRQMCYVLNHPDFLDDDGQLAEIYSVRGNCCITKEGDPDLFFEAVALDEVTGAAAAVAVQQV